nr:copper ion binding protein [Clostridia bacterium]
MAGTQVAATKHVVLPVRGMSCAACVAHVEKALKSLAGVIEAKVNLMAGKAAVDYEPEKVSIPDMVRVVTDVGFEIVTEELSVKVAGMTCAACVNKVERTVKKLPGVANAVVNLATESAKVEYYPGTVTKSEIKQAIEALGYNVEERGDAQSELDREREAREAEISRQRRNMWLTWPVSLIAMLGTMREMWILDRFIPEWLGNNFT